MIIYYYVADNCTIDYRFLVIYVTGFVVEVTYIKDPKRVYIKNNYTEIQILTDK